MIRFGYLLYSMFILMLFSCVEDGRIDNAGYLYLGVDEDNTTITRSKPVTDEELRVYIISSADDTICTYTDYITQVKGQKLVLPAGTYKVSVSSAEQKGAVWNEPFYSGSEEIVIKADEITQTQVVCQIANTKVSVKYTDLDKYFTDYVCTVSTESESLEYAKDEYRAGYFTSEGDLVANLYLRNKDGNTFNLKKIVARDIKPRYHYTIIYKVDTDDSDENAGADIDISVDDEAEEIEYTISIKEDALIGDKTPKIELNNVDNNVLTWRPYRMDENNQPVLEPKPDPAPVLKIRVPAGIKEKKIEVVSDNNRFTESSLGLVDSEIESGSGQEINLNETLLSDPTIWKDIEVSEEHSFNISIIDMLNQEVSVSFKLVITPNVAVETLSANAFTTFAFLQGKSADKEGIGFKVWTGDDKASAKFIEAETIDGDIFGAIVTGLLPGTVYNYCAVSGNNEGTEHNIITSNETLVENLNFDANWNELKPAGPWDSGNEGAKSGKGSPQPTKEENEIVVSGKAIKMVSQKINAYVLETFAAGNIYTGSFVKAIIDIKNPGAELDFGIPYDSYPTTLTGYYMYQPVIVDNGSEGGMSGKMDICTIYVALCYWPNGPFRVNTQTKEFVNPNADYIIAYGEISEKEAMMQNMTEYKPFEITLKYKDLTHKPTHILIVASASKYGDYFTGGNGSTLYIDEFSLGFDYNAESFKGTEMEGLTTIDITKQ